MSIGDDKKSPPCIMLDARHAFRERRSRLIALALKIRKALNREVGCLVCGDEGPHENKGAELCCRTCGENCAEHR